MAVSITEGGTGSIDLVQQRSDRSAQNDVISEEAIDKPQVPRFIYSKLGNLTNHKTILLSDMETEQDEYKFFMMEMERFQITGEDVSNIAALDEYLGDLGQVFSYPFEDDVYDLPSWISYDYTINDRNVVESADDNIITSSGENIIHNGTR